MRFTILKDGSMVFNIVLNRTNASNISMRKKDFPSKTAFCNSTMLNKIPKQKKENSDTSSLGMFRQSMRSHLKANISTFTALVSRHDQMWFVDVLK